MNDSAQQLEMNQMLELVVSRNASDLHLISGVPPMLRIDGELAPIPSEQVLTPDRIEKLLKAVMTPDVKLFQIGGGPRGFIGHFGIPFLHGARVYFWNGGPPATANPP